MTAQTAPALMMTNADRWLRFIMTGTFRHASVMEARNGRMIYLIWM